MSESVAMSWSGGKDSTLALHEILTSERYRDYEVPDLLTTVTAGYDRVSGHGIHRDLVLRQAECLGITPHLAYIPTTSTMRDYETVMGAAYTEFKNAGTPRVAFGDIFLKGPKGIHLNALRRVDMAGVFPLWHRNSLASVHRLIELGYQAMVICVDAGVLDESFLGQLVDETFLRNLPASVDPSGENGEYHTLVVDGPVFRNRVDCAPGEVVSRAGHHYLDVRLVTNDPVTTGE